MADEVINMIPGKRGATENSSGYNSFAAMSNEEQESIRTTGHLDPLATTVVQEERLPAHLRAQASKPLSPHNVVTMSGHADPLYAKAGLTIGDRVYHKARKKEGTVKDLSATGKAFVEFDDAEGWQKQENLVKL